MIKGDRFYFITDHNNVIYDYGKITSYNSTYYNSQLLPYGGSKAYNVYGYDENGYDNKGYKTDGYNDAGYDRDGYDKKGFNSDGYDRDGYDKNGYDRDGYGRDGYNKKGYDEAGYDHDGYDRNGYDREGYDKDGYNVKRYKRDGYNYYGFNKDGINKDGYIYTYNNTVSGFLSRLYGYTISEYNKGYIQKWNQDGSAAITIGSWTGSSLYNFEVAVQKKIRKSYSNIGLLCQAVSPLSSSKSKTKYKSGIVYITVPKSYVNRKGKKTNIYYLAITRNAACTSTKIYKITSRYMKVKLHFGDTIKVGNYTNVNTGSVCVHPFAYKYVPSTTWIKTSTMTNYKGKLINPDVTKVTTKKNKTTRDIVYLSNMDYNNIIVKTTNKDIVTATKINFSYDTFDYAKAVKYKIIKFDNDAKIMAINLKGGKNKGTATVTIKNKVTGKTQKIKVTNK